MKGYTEYVEAQTTGRKCDHCGKHIEHGKGYLHLVKNRHIYIICNKCLVIFGRLAERNEPTAKADAMAEII